MSCALETNILLPNMFVLQYLFYSYCLFIKKDSDVVERTLIVLSILGPNASNAQQVT